MAGAAESIYSGLWERSFDEGELEEIREFIEEEFSEPWDIEIREDTAVFTYDDGNEYEEIHIEPMESEYGGKYYVITAFSASWHDRIYHCGECFECVGEDCPLYELSEDVKKLDEYIDREIKEWTSAEQKVVEGFWGKIRVRRAVYEVDYPDFAVYYRGVEIQARLQRSDQVFALLKLRDFFYALV